MTINNLLLSNNCNDNSSGFIAQKILQETSPYTINKNILGENLYTWNKDFIDRVIESFTVNIVADLSKKEKDLFDRYTYFLIHGTGDIIEEDVQKLDLYIGSLNGDN